MRNAVLRVALGFVLAGCVGVGARGPGGPSGSAYIGKNAAGQEVLTRMCLPGQPGKDCEAMQPVPAAVSAWR